MKNKKREFEFLVWITILGTVVAVATFAAVYFLYPRYGFPEQIKTQNLYALL